MSDAAAPERWGRIREVFDAASELSGEARDAFLSATCNDDQALRREVESLLAFDAPRDERLGRAVIESVTSAAPAFRTDAQRPDHIGPYKLLSAIGQGGMGTVYLARRDDGLRVAVKVGRSLLGEDGVRRFRAERQMLASLQHAGVAALLDAGATPDGLPYFVMELVDGLPIDEYCDQHSLTTRQRVDLFIRVCGAVAHAHRSLIVHRDLKPSNILVTAEGQPKLLDFGIAKLMDEAGSGTTPLTDPSMRMLTPHYASPEQLRGAPVTVATDVYSLGVLLFKLLTGARPYEIQDLEADKVERIICTQDPDPPSAKAGRRTPKGRELAGDLDAIVIMALRKEPERRYSSVDDLADDLRRFLDRRPVSARPADWSYRPLRFVQRHRVGVAAAAIFGALIVGLTALLVMSGARAARERDAATRVSSMLVRIFSDANAHADLGDVRTARELLDQAVEQVRRELQNQPAVQARLFDALGSIYASRGLLDEAQGVLREAVAARQADRAADSPPTARTLWRLADTLREHGEYATAEAPAREAVAMSERLYGRHKPEVARALNTLGLILHASGRADEAAPMFAEAADIFSDTLGPTHPTVAQSLQNIARSRRDRSELDGAADAAGRAFAMATRSFVPMVIESASSLAVIVERGGRLEDAAALRREVESLSRQLQALPPEVPR